MKKVLLIALVAALVIPVFADDALVMPAQVFRTYITGAYATVNNAYDNDGKTVDISSNAVTVFNMGAALEVGINDWITGAVQWAPGYNVYSKIDGMDKATLADAADLFVGAKLQIVGPKAPVQNETFRFAVAPGVKIPLSSPDWVTEATNAGTGKDFLAGGADKHTFGFGGRGYFDYVINEMFFLNLYTQFIYYPLAVDFKNANITAAGTWATIHAGDSTYNPTIMYGYDLTLEFEPHFNTMISDGLELEAGVPVTYTMSPKEDVSGDTYAAYTPNPDTNLLTVGPNVSLFFQKTFLPIEVKVGYTLPLMGKNTESVNTLLLELKVYAKY